MSEVLFHIGYHKTATTFMQDTLFPSHPNVRLVPRTEVQSHYLRVGVLHFSAKEVRAWLDEIRAEAEIERKWVVLSDEELSGNIHSGGGGGYVGAAVADRIYATCPDAHILVLVRSQVRMIDSIYRQYVKMGGTFGIDDYLHKRSPAIGNHRFPQFMFEHLEYDRLVAYYLEKFGRDRVHVYPFEQMRESSADFWGRCLDDIGLGRIESVEDLVARSLNPSYSKLAVAIARRTNRLYGADPINRRALVDVPGYLDAAQRVLSWLDRTRWFRRMSRGGSFITPRLEAEIEQRYGASNARLEGLIGIDLSSLGYPIEKRWATTP